MKRYILGGCVAFLVSAGTAYAGKITNLDHVTHTVRIDAAGTPYDEEIASGATTRFFTDGTVSLISVPEKQASHVAAHGFLTGTIGKPGTSIAVESGDELVIWPHGQLMIQRRIKLHDGMN